MSGSPSPSRTLCPELPSIKGHFVSLQSFLATKRWPPHSSFPHSAPAHVVIRSSTHSGRMCDNTILVDDRHTHLTRVPKQIPNAYFTLLPHPGQMGEGTYLKTPPSHHVDNALHWKWTKTFPTASFHCLPRFPDHHNANNEVRSQVTGRPALTIIARKGPFI